MKEQIPALLNVPYGYRSCKTAFSPKLYVSILFLMIGIFFGNMATATSYLTRQSGHWNSSSTWSTYQCGSATNTGSFPMAGDDVTICSGHTVTLTANASCAAITVQSTAASTTLIVGDWTLTVSGQVFIGAPANNNTLWTNEISIGAGSLTAGNIQFNPGGNMAYALLSLATGTINCTGDLDFGLNLGPSGARALTVTSTGTINIEGDFGSNNYPGTFNAGSGTVNCKGATAQLICGYTYNRLKINNNADVTLLSAATITTLTIGDATPNSNFYDYGSTITPGTGSTLNLTSGTYNLGSPSSATTWPAWATINMASGTTIGYNSGVAQTVSSIPSYQHLTMSRTGTKTLGGNISVAGNLNIASGSSLNMGTYTANRATAGGTLTVAGTLSLAGSSGGQTGSNFPTNYSTLSMTDGTVSYNNASGGQTIYATPAYNNLTLANTSGTQNAGGALTVNGTLTTTAGSTLNMGTYALGGTLGSITNGGTIRTQNTGATPVATGKTWGGTMIYDAAAQTVVAGTYNNLTLSGSGTKTLGGSTATNGDLLIGTGVVANLGTVTTHTANTLHLASTSTANGTWGSTSSIAANTNNTFFAATSGYVTVIVSLSGSWTGATSSDWGTASNWTTGIVPLASSDVIISTSSNPPVISATAVCSNITINSGGALTIIGSNALTVAGNWSNSGTFTANSSTVHFNGSAAQTMVGSSAGTFSTLSVNNTTGVTLGAAQTITTLTIGDVTANSIFNDGGYVITPGSGSTMNLTSGTYNLGSVSTATSWPAWATRNIAAGTTIGYIATPNQTVSATPAYQNLTLGGANWKTIAAGLSTIAGNLTLSSGAVALPNGFTVGGNLIANGGLALSSATVNVTGNFSGNGQILNFGGTPVINVGGDWNFSGTSADPLNATFNGTGSQALSGIVTTYSNTPSSAIITVNKASGTLTLGSNISIGKFVLTRGVFDPAAYKLSLLPGGTATLTAGTLRVGATSLSTNYSFTPSPPAGFTIEYYHANPTISNSLTYQNLQFSGSGTAGASGALTIQGNLTNTGGGTLNFGANNVTLSGTVAANSIAGYTTTGLTQMTKTSGTATFTGNVSGGALTINGGGTLNLGSGLTQTFTGLWTRTNGTLDGGSSTVNFTAATVGSGTGGTFTPNTGTVAYSRAEAQTVPVLTYNGLTLSGSGAKTFATGPTVNGVLSLEGTATPTILSGTITYGSNSTLQYNKAATFSSTTTEWPATFSGTGGVIIKNSGAVTLDGTKAVGAGLSIESGSALTIPSAMALTVNGTLTNSAGNTGLVIQSNASATGSLIHNSASIGATVNRYISGNAEAWHFISSPVSGQAISGSWTPAGSYTDGSGYDFYAYSEPSNMWLNKKDLANNIASFNVGQGYMIAYQASNPTKTFAGNLNNGSTSIAITRSGTSTYVGSNLVGNPYSSSIDWKADPGWTRTNLVSNGSGYDLYIWNQTVDNYGVYNSASVTDAGTNSASRYIGPMQGFIVAASGSGNLIMDNNVRVHNNAGTWLKNTETESNTIRIKALSENGYGSDEAIVEYGHAGNTGGAEKMFSFVETAPSVYLPKDNTDYSISFLKSVTDTYLVPLNFKAGADGTYRMEFTFDPSAFTMAELEDHSTGMRQNLKESTVYSFSSGTTDAADRFTIHFGAVGINEDEAAGQLRAYVYNNNLYIENEAAKAILQLFDLKGRLIESVSFNETGLICHPLQIPAGLYVVRLQTETSVKTAKVFVK